MKTYKIVIAVPNEGHTQAESYNNHMVIMHRLGRLEEKLRQQNAPIQYEFHFHTTGRLLTAYARETLTQKAIDSDCDFMFQFDDDMILPYDVFDRLLEDMIEHPEIDLVAPLAFMRNPPHYAVIYTSTEGYDPQLHKSYFRNDFVKDYPRDQLVECDAVGFGMVCIRMDKVRKMKPPFFFSTTGSGEDLFFCYNFRRQTDARIFMDTRVKLGHLSKPRVIDEEYVDKWNKENDVKFEEKPYKYNSESR